MLRLRKALESGQLLSNNERQAKVHAHARRRQRLSRNRASSSSARPSSMKAPARSRCARFSRIRSSRSCPACSCGRVLQEGVREHGILVPQRGVTRNPHGDAMVMTVGADEKVEPRVIKDGPHRRRELARRRGIETRRPRDSRRSSESAARHAGEGGAFQRHSRPHGLAAPPIRNNSRFLACPLFSSTAPSSHG